MSRIEIRGGESKTGARQTASVFAEIVQSARPSESESDEPSFTETPSLGSKETLSTSTADSHLAHSLRRSERNNMDRAH